MRAERPPARALLPALAILALGAAGAPARGEEPAGRVVLRWQAVPGAGGYDLQVAADAGFTRRELEVRVEVAGYRLSLPATGARRYWRVRTLDADGRPGPWSAAKTIEPFGAAPAQEVAPPPAPPAPDPLDVAFDPAALPAPSEPVPAPMTASPPELRLAPRAGEEPPPYVLPPEAAPRGPGFADWLRQGRPGLSVAWRANLIGVQAAALGAEGSWPIPPLGAAFRASLRAGWWRERATVPTSAGLDAPIDAVADVVPIAALATWGRTVAWARLYGGLGAGVDLVVIRQRTRGALAASGALLAVAGAARRLGGGELFGELAGGLGGVDAPLGRLRTGGVALAVGYRLAP